MNLWKKPSVMLKAQWQNVFQYRAMIFIWMFETFFVPFVMLLVWQPIAHTNVLVLLTQPW